MIDTAKIKANILSCAFKGMLVAYFEEKTNYALDGLHKRVKKYVPVSEDEYLIDAPKRWRWSRLGYVTNNHGQKEPQEDFCYIDVGTLDNVNHCLAKKENLVNKEDAPSRARKIVEQGDVLYSTVRPYLHNICIINKEFSKTPVASTAFCVMAVEREVLINKFLFYWLLSAEFDKFSNGNPSKGTLYPAIGEKDLLNGVIPIPCVEEQQLIVEKIDSAFECLDKLNRLQTQYSSDLEILKSKIIDAGIQGRLTEQLPEDGTADELLEQIVNCQNNMIKAGKIKKPKDIKNIDIEDIPFEIPNTWKWEKWGNIINVVSARRVHQSDWRKEGIPFYRAREIAKLAVDGSVENDLFISQELYDEFSIDRVPQPGDLMVSAVGTLGKSYVVKDGDLFYYKDASVLCFENYGGMNPYYLRYVMQSSLMKNQIESNSGGTTVDTLTMVRMVQYILPIPPLNEQDRIVSKINEILEIL